MLRMATPASANFKTMRVHEVLDHSLRLLQPQVSGKLITVKKNYRAETDAVRGDDAQLQQTFMNLFLNALEAMGPNGTLAISTEIAGGESGARVLQIQIQDTGVGITPENRAHLFEPFFTTKEKRDGSRLGNLPAHHPRTSRLHPRAKRGRQKFAVQHRAAIVYRMKRAFRFLTNVYETHERVARKYPSGSGSLWRRDLFASPFQKPLPARRERAFCRKLPWPPVILATTLRGFEKDHTFPRLFGSASHANFIIIAGSFTKRTSKTSAAGDISSPNFWTDVGWAPWNPPRAWMTRPRSTSTKAAG